MLNYTKSLKSVDQIAQESDWSPKRVRSVPIEPHIKGYRHEKPLPRTK
jgi:hypothetical protein